MFERLNLALKPIARTTMITNAATAIITTFFVLILESIIAPEVCEALACDKIAFCRVRIPWIIRMRVIALIP